MQYMKRWDLTTTSLELALRMKKQDYYVEKKKIKNITFYMIPGITDPVPEYIYKYDYSLAKAKEIWNTDNQVF